MNYIVVSLILSLSLFANSYKADITSDEAYQMQKDGAVVIDVRTPIEFFYVGHGRGHINIPSFYIDAKPKSLKYRLNFANIESKSSRALNKSMKMYELEYIENQNFVDEVKEVVKDDFTREILLICRTGPRSQEAANLLAEEGFENVYNISDGFRDGWSRLNLPSASQK